jgi:hypothetical protein
VIRPYFMSELATIYHVFRFAEHAGELHANGIIFDELEDKNATK